MWKTLWIKMPTGLSIGCGYVENPVDKDTHRVFNRLWITCEPCG
jgi:hypothetical protein